MQRDFQRSLKLAFEKMERGRVFEGKAVRVSEVAEEYNCVRSLLAYCCGAARLWGTALLRGESDRLSRRRRNFPAINITSTVS